MFRFIGIVVVSLALVGGVLYFNDFWDGKASFRVTPKGRQMLNSSLDSVKDGINSGLDKLKATTDNELDNMKATTNGN